MSPKKNPDRKRTCFGAYITGLREEKTTLSVAKAAEALELNSRQRLDNWEVGPGIPPDSILIKMAQLYGVAPEEMIRRAYWPQLVLLPLISILDPQQLTEEVIREIEQGLRTAERQKLSRFITGIIQERKSASRLTK